MINRVIIFYSNSLSIRSFFYLQLSYTIFIEFSLLVLCFDHVLFNTLSFCDCSHFSFNFFFFQKKSKFVLQYLQSTKTKSHQSINNINFFFIVLQSTLLSNFGVKRKCKLCQNKIIFESNFS